MQFELMASMMCANYGNLEKEVKELEEGGIDSFHIDIMDGRYVPNFAMSLNDMRYIAGATSKPLDVHLMIEHPNNRINLFLGCLRKGDRYIFTQKQSTILLPPYKASLMLDWFQESQLTQEHPLRR